MPAKPKLKYTDLSLPNAYIKFVNAVADISLECSNKDTATKEDFNKEMQRLADLFNDLGIKYVKEDYINFLTFNITNEGDVTFELSSYLNPKLLPLFNTDFYGKITLVQFSKIVDWCYKHQQELLDIQTWLDYRNRLC